MSLMSPASALTHPPPPIAPVALLVLCIDVFPGPLLEQSPQLSVRDVVGAAHAHHRAPQVLGHHQELGVHADGLVRLLLDLGEGVDDDGEQEVEQDHEDEELVAPEEERAGDVLEPRQGSEVVVDVDVAEQDLKAGVDRVSKGREFL